MINLHFNALSPETPTLASEIPRARGPVEGDYMLDGTIYAGFSPATGKAMYAAPTDAPLTYTYNEAQKYAETRNAQKLLGHDDWRMPTEAELYVLFNNRAAIGGFNVSGSYPAGWYWPVTPSNEWNVQRQRFSDGEQFDYGKDHPSSLRLVRTETGPKP